MISTNKDYYKKLIEEAMKQKVSLKERLLDMERLKKKPIISKM